MKNFFIVNYSLSNIDERIITHIGDNDINVIASLKGR